MPSTRFRDVQDALPQTLANLEIVLDMPKRYHKGVEQALVLLPQGRRSHRRCRSTRQGVHRLRVDHQPAAAVLDRLPSGQRMARACGHHESAGSEGLYCKIPKETPSNVVRGARNYPCADFPGKRGATPKPSAVTTNPGQPLGTNPWIGDPNQIVNCPAPGARCDQPVNPGTVIPAPSINNGMNPLPANMVPGTAPDERRSDSSGDWFGTVQRPATQPVYVHCRQCGRVQPGEWRTGRPGWCEVHRQQFEQYRRRRMEGDAGSGQLNPTPPTSDAGEESNAESFTSVGERGSEGTRRDGDRRLRTETSSEASDTVAGPIPAGSRLASRNGLSLCVRCCWWLRQHSGQVGILRFCGHIPKTRLREPKRRHWQRRRTV